MAMLNFETLDIYSSAWIKCRRTIIPHQYAGMTALFLLENSRVAIVTNGICLQESSSQVCQRACT